ncbi:hypothetical protein [Cronobacter turicensis]|uniref:hypothetical protein n=1 Tax=Cronobacter turicensis TaxID=413502 RepID=UPI0024C2406A|nr:hypothetical protein [Cronobacter turicensis]MDK1185328.1 hypothetical protein [Cronobacter turicensis]MDK1206213.1 hypothetical protein [Cronobacter turicensis]MDK1216228.1 hypothetical protein [Cronobacter turicensis]MDK1218956.1 hypothetical protein [Cronobacter turicensis]MDK1231145.1 hypothetical protein [Cronobacter turicensis]
MSTITQQKKVTKLTVTPAPQEAHTRAGAQPDFTYDCMLSELEAIIAEAEVRLAEEAAA